MNGQMLVERVRESKETELTRLSSDKALLAATGSDLSTDAILSTVALSLDGLRTTLAAWAHESSADTSAAFADAAETLDGEYDRVVTSLGDSPDGHTPTPVEKVRTFENPARRVAAGFVGHGLVFDGLLLQVVSFFVNEADETRADLARDLRSSANSRIDRGAVVLDSLCADDEDWDRAEAAASDVVEAAYHGYVEILGEMGIDPKPVC